MRKYAWLIAITAGVLQAQTYTGSIRGRASDPSGLPVVGAAVTVTETDSNTVRKTATNDVGDYIVSFLKPGDYRLSVVATYRATNAGTQADAEIDHVHVLRPV